MSGELPFTGFIIPGGSGGGGTGTVTTGGDAIADNDIVRGLTATSIQGGVATLDDNGTLSINNANNHTLYHGGPSEDGAFYVYLDGGSGSSLEIDSQANVLTDTFIEYNIDGDGCFFAVNTSGATTSEINLNASGASSEINIISEGVFNVSPLVSSGGTQAKPAFKFGTGANEIGVYRLGGTVIGFNITPFSPFLELFDSIFRIGTAFNICWTPTDAADSADFGITRSAVGVGRINNGSSGIGALLKSNLVEANTAGSGAPNVLLLTESGTVLTNEGASAENYHTLPTAVAGYEFTFVVQDADGIRITAAAGDTIRPIAGTAASATGGFIRCATQGAFITLVAINATEWHCIGSSGIWTIDV